MGGFHRYHVFGLNIESAIPFLDIPETEGAADVTIDYGTVPDDLPGATIKGVRYQAGGGEFLLRVDNVARYYVANGATIIVEPHPGGADHEILLFLMGSAMGALLHQRKVLPLHGSAVSQDGSGIIFLGPSAIGKSTLAAGFQKQGYALLADDVCAVTAQNGDTPRIIPGFPRLKLWRDALEKLEENKRGLNRVRLDETFEKYFLPFQQPQSDPVPVGAVFLLKTTNTDTLALSELKGNEKIDPLITNTYRARFLKGMGDKREHFRLCAAVAGKASVFQVTRPLKGFRLEELMALVEEHF